MEEELVVLNPRRRRRRRMSAAQRRYFGPRRRRRSNPVARRARSRRRSNPVMALNPRRRRSHRVYGRARRRSNPPMAILGSVMETVKEGVVATIGVQANNLVGNMLSQHVLGVTGQSRSAVKVGTAVLLPSILSMFFPQYRRQLCSAGAAAIAVEASKFLNKNVYPSIPGGYGELLSTYDTPNTMGTGGASPGGASGLGYVPGGAVYPGYNDAEPRLGAYVPRMLNARSSPGVYAEDTGVY